MNVLSDLALWISSILAAGAFVVGIVSLFCPEGLRAWKEARGHYDKHYPYRKDIRDFGIALITISGVLSTFLYSGISHRLALQSFLADKRPFVKVQPLETNDKLYEITPNGKDLYVTPKVRLVNVGSVPAYNVSIICGIEVGAIGITASERELRPIIFPDDYVNVYPRISVGRRDGTELKKEELEKILASNDMIVRIHVDYGGVDAKRSYFTVHNLRYPADKPGRHEIIFSDADRSFE